MNVVEFSNWHSSWSLRVNPSVQLNQSPRKRVFVESWAKKEENIVRCNTVYTRVKWLVVKDQLIQIQNAPLLQRQCYAGRLKMRDMKIRDGQKCRGGKCETWIFGTRLQGWKMRDMKMRHQNARVENAGKVSMESQSVKKCLKVVVYVCRVIPSV